MRPLVAATLLLAACASAPRGAPSDPDAAGERLYRSHCAACHRLRDPSEETRERWAWAVNRFGPRAHLSEEERQLVLGYLAARAKDAPAPGAAGKAP
jgi:mono/diheme cytochrome c family protein